MSNLQARLDRYREAVEMVDRGEARELTVRVVELLRKGVLPVDMAERLGRASSTVYQSLNDPTDAQNRARKNERHGTCRDCGAPTYNSGSLDLPERCDPCRRNLYAERNARLVELWEADVPVREIAAEIGVSEDSVYSHVDRERHRNGASITLRRRRDRELWPAIERLWGEGLTAREIAERFGTNQKNVQQMVHMMRKACIDLPRRQKVAA